MLRNNAQKKKEDLFEAIFEFQNRERRFGKTSEQLKEENLELVTVLNGSCVSF